METRASFVLVGAFVLSFFIAVIAAVVWLAGLELNSDTTRYDVFFKGSVTGLSVGSPVRYNGIPIGSISSLRISPDRFGEVQVVIDVPKDTPIREDAVARLETQGITGVGFIEINGGTESAPPLTAKLGQERPEIRSDKSALQQVFENAPEIMSNLKAVSEQAAKLLNDENIAHLQGTIANIDKFSGALSDSSEDVAALLQQGAGAMEQFKRVAVEGERLVAAFADRSEGIAGAAEETIQDLSGFAKKLNDLAVQATPILENANQTVQNFSAVGDDIRGQVKKVSDQLSGTIDRLDGTIGQTDNRIAALMGQAQSSLKNADVMMSTATGRIDSVADSAEDTLGEYKGLAQTMAPMVTSVASDTTKAVKDFSAISGELKSAAVNIAAAADEARLLIKENRDPVTNFTSNGLFEFTQLLSEMRVLVSSLSRITNQIERDPAQFFFGDSQQGYEVQ
ncbi:MAG: MlaD family protein [Alphaproteobacteria bacterium]|nr:MlaD family protein [Alphaproteobacteria bacterium]